MLLTNVYAKTDATQCQIRQIKEMERITIIHTLQLKTNMFGIPYFKMFYQMTETKRYSYSIR